MLKMFQENWMKYLWKKNFVEKFHRKQCFEFKAEKEKKKTTSKKKNPIKFMTIESDKNAKFYGFNPSLSARS